MLTRFLRENVYAAGLLMVLRLYLGYQWFTAGLHKLTGGFDAAGFLKGAIAKPVLDKATNELVYPTFTAFLQHFALPNVKLINFLIPVGETLVGLGLILGALTTAAAFFGLMMNFMFLFAGTVSTNPWLILLGVIVLMAGTNAGRFGVDHYLMPFLRKLRRQGGHEAGRGNGTAAKV
ncbi:DoxX family protein [Paenibacillus caseinilyticus]|uniref:Crp/Fnr family transcriptional regulator n=1 Tax=Paenibacillus mucilaginosus K02 TaxID=997761 RepID=I0BAV1_9BACL|nr:DoxX family protein [Paenibacillus mucilaginosus]AFH59498.1 Crp/Fnr family transcriptional regulator [Paenibacillus mucilaginosus K02]WFA16266.1 DoxX family protein [Paenibacillus mucilaginosus]